jgi:hypothetical protein
LDLNNKFKIYSKNPKLRKTHFVIYLSKINVIAGGAKSLLLCTGCKSDIWKKVQVNILKESLLVLKQTIHQQKALDLSFNMAP